MEWPRAAGSFFWLGVYSGLVWKQLRLNLFIFLKTEKDCTKAAKAKAEDTPAAPSPAVPVPASAPAPVPAAAPVAAPACCAFACCSCACFCACACTCCCACCCLLPSPAVPDLQILQGFSLGICARKGSIDTALWIHIHKLQNHVP
jgi:hypothetical protein